MIDPMDMFEEDRRRQRASSYDELDRLAEENAGDGGIPLAWDRPVGYNAQGQGPRRQQQGNRQKNAQGHPRNNMRNTRQDGNPEQDERVPQRSTRRPARARQVEHFDEEGRINSVYRPARQRSRYDRNSNRYTSANAENRREGRREEYAPRQQKAAQRGADAARYRRDRYIRQEGQHRAVPVSQQSYAAANRAKPPSAKLFGILGVIAAALLAIIVARFVFFGTTVAEYNGLKQEIDAQQTHIEELQTSDNDLQTQMNAWQETIDVYNKSRQ